MNTQTLLSVSDLVALTGWKRRTIYKKGRLGEIPGRVKLGKKSLRFRVSDVEKWLAECGKQSYTTT